MEEQDLGLLIQQYQDVLEKYFISQGDFKGMAITKDNCEDLFDVWVSNITESELNWIVSKDTISKLQ